jgi:hypothetical protein
MLEIARESLYELVSDADKLFQDHHEENIGNELEFTPDWDYYSANENADTLRIYTARHSGELVGYAVFFVMPHRKHKNSIFAVSDAIYLRPDMRLGANVLKLFNFAERSLKEDGVQKIMITLTTKKDFRPLLYRLGYENEEVTVSKFI